MRMIRDLFSNDYLIHYRYTDEEDERDLFSNDYLIHYRYTDEDDERDLFSPPRDQRPFMFRSPSHATSSQTPDSRRAPLQREVAGFYDHQSPNSSRVIVDPI